jgi:hypothetical protein
MLKAFSYLMAALSALSGFILFLNALGAFTIADAATLWILFFVGGFFTMGGWFSAQKPDSDDYEKPN